VGGGKWRLLNVLAAELFLVVLAFHGVHGANFAFNRPCDILLDATHPFLSSYAVTSALWETEPSREDRTAVHRGYLPPPLAIPAFPGITGMDEAKSDDEPAQSQGSAHYNSSASQQDRLLREAAAFSTGMVVSAGVDVAKTSPFTARRPADPREASASTLRQTFSQEAEGSSLRPRWPDDGKFVYVSAHARKRGRPCR